jgi:ribonuclease BN (tRNA processing enzyme)
MAAEAGVKQLILSHLMRRTINRKDETLRIIRQKYKGTVIFPDDLDVIRP